MTYVEQAGGDHYQAEPGQQHWDLCDRFDVDGLAWCATKHVTRWRRKGTPALDLQKAITYCDKMLAGRRGARRTVPTPALTAFFRANDTETPDRMVIAMILAESHGTVLDVEEARHKLQLMLDELEKPR